MHKRLKGYVLKLKSVLLLFWNPILQNHIHTLIYNYKKAFSIPSYFCQSDSLLEWQSFAAVNRLQAVNSEINIG